MITGGTGTFGNAVLRRFLHKLKLEKSVSSAATEKKQDEMRNTLKNKRVKLYLGNVREQDTLDVGGQRSEGR